MKKYGPHDGEVHASAADVFLDFELAVEMRNTGVLVRTGDGIVDKVCDAGILGGVGNVDALANFALDAGLMRVLHRHHAIGAVQGADQ